MENKKQNCSYKEHKDINAICYCFKCQIYLCNKCINYHKNLFDDHPINNLDKITEETFSGFCQEENHNLILEYFCKTHNVYVKLKEKEKGNIKIAIFVLLKKSKKKKNQN